MKFKIVTLGCKVNTYESEAVKSLFLARDYLPCSKNEIADIILVNTCTVTSISDQKSRQKIRSEISKNPHAIVIVMGCYSQMSPEIIKSIDGVHIIVGTNMRHKICELIDEYQINRQQINLVEEKKRDFPFEPLKVTSYSDNTRAFVKIQDGCDNFCSYCIIPYARGKMRSRAPLDVILEIKSLVESGFKEIVLTGIHTAGYGRDLIDYSFTDLIKDIIKFPKLIRLRISSIEESEITDELVDLIKEHPVIARHLHIPLQSGSETVLKRMNRKYNKQEFVKRLNDIRTKIPGIALTSDVIVGFPKETEEEYLETYEFIKTCGFNMLHVFPYSIRSGTPAASMDGQVEQDVKKSRVQKLIELSNSLKEAYFLKFINSPEIVIIETYDETRKLYKGYTSNYLEVFVKSNEDIRGQTVEIILNKPYSVQKRILR